LFIYFTRELSFWLAHWRLRNLDQAQKLLVRTLRVCWVLFPCFSLLLLHS